MMVWVMPYDKDNLVINWFVNKNVIWMSKIVFLNFVVEMYPNVLLTNCVSFGQLAYFGVEKITRMWRQSGVIFPYGLATVQLDLIWLKTLWILCVFVYLSIINLRTKNFNLSILDQQSPEITCSTTSQKMPTMIYKNHTYFWTDSSVQLSESE